MTDREKYFFVENTISKIASESELHGMRGIILRLEEYGLINEKMCGWLLKLVDEGTLHPEYKSERGKAFAQDVREATDALCELFNVDRGDIR